jgi:signal transduction histidine kinase
MIDDIKHKTEAQIRDALKRASSLNWIHWLIIILSVLLTISAWAISKNTLHQKIEAQFSRETDLVITQVKERMALYENALWSAVALMDVFNGHVNSKQWATYAGRLHLEATYPGINGMGVIFNVQKDELASYLAQQRIQRPNYSIHPAHNATEYWPITYVEPVASNKKAIGLDMAFENNRYSAIKKARDSGLAQLTAPITLVQDNKSTPGFLLYTPFYNDRTETDSIGERRKNILGVTYAPFIMANFMRGTLEKQKRHILLTIKDGDALLYTDNDQYNVDNQLDINPLFKKQLYIDINGRQWTFDIEANKSFRQASANNQPSIILLGGLFIDSLLLGLFLFLTKANRDALDHADAMTLRLKDKAVRLEKSNKDLEQFSYIASHDLKSPLNAIKSLASWINEDCKELLPAESKAHLNLLQSRVDRMTKLLADLLSYSRINRLAHDNGKINLNAAVKNCFEMLGNPKGFSYDAPDIEISIPVIPFEIVLRNLISNSIKHHDQKTGNIKLTYQKIIDFHCINITDNGPGIPADLQEKVMEMFQTLKPRDQVEGSGMGLAFVKKIVEHHHGTVTIDSDGQRFTTFIIHWPLYTQTLDS